MSAKVFRLIECDPSESVETRIVRYAEKEITNEIHVPVHFGTLYSGRGSGVKILPKNPRSCPRSHRFSSVFRQSRLIALLTLIRISKSWVLIWVDDDADCECLQGWTSHRVCEFLASAGRSCVARHFSQRTREMGTRPPAETPILTRVYQRCHPIPENLP